MTGSAGSPRVPGATLLAIARLLFNDDVVAAVVQPTISDLQREIAEAGPRRLARLRARWRGYCAFWKLALVILFTRWPAPAGNGGTVMVRDLVQRLAVGFAAVTLVAVVGPTLGAPVSLATAIAASICAVMIHAWYARHPSVLPDPDPSERQWRPPQINFSSTDVAGNSGGLIFVIGTVFIVAVGLPSVVWFLLAAVIGACVVAWGLVTWRTSHERWELPEKRLGGSR
jgi:hypothetical protein